MNNYIWLNEFNQANIWQILEKEGDRIFCRLPILNREGWFHTRDALGFWVWWKGQRRYCYDRRNNRVLIEIQINGLGKELWVDSREVTPLTLEENQEFANQKMAQLSVLEGKSFSIV